MPFKSEKQRKWMWANDPKMAAKWEKKEKKMKREMKVRELIKKMVREELAGLDEAAKRDYKAEYKKFQSSDKSKKYRAELNKYNRQKGTYGNGDGKDASHKGGKIVGFEKESVNRGRAEKSRLKKEEKVSEAISGSDRKIMFMIVRDIIENLKKAGAKKPSNQIGRGVLSILRAMTYTPDNANYKNYKKYFPKTFNSKLTQKRVAQFHKQTDKVQLTMVKQAMNKVLGEGKLNERLHVVDERYVGKYIIWVLQDGNKIRTAVLGKKGFDNFSSNDPDDLKKLWNLTKKFKGKPIPDIATEGKLTEKKMDRKKAAIILKQIGGNRFIAMTGAKGFAFSDKYISFKIGRNSKGINFVRIGHNAMDTYDMEFGFVSVKGIKVKKKVKGVYADMLGQIFKKHTGMNVSL